MTTTNKLVDNKAPMMGVINISFDCQEIYDKIIFTIRWINLTRNWVNIKSTHLQKKKLTISTDFTSFLINNLSCKTYPTSCKYINILRTLDLMTDCKNISF